ncbi:MAG: Asp-tRNA(Asn)/Glu-tRNA(Gln) amidotransferase A subunit family amidase [Gammaproteobacteria bacterium]|jgi:Asp-tRNA(Asn)/Glu-tRNA(Gln) amidotransferase A subunit family amidase
MDLTELSASAAAQLLRDKSISAVELTQACLQRIAERNNDVGAFRHIDPDFSLAQAARADRDVPRSPLHGIPFAVKDVIDTRDFPTEYGTKIHAGRRPSVDAKCVSLMREAGAVLLGKVVSTEYAMFTPNETRHPMNLEHTAGGSSSGTAAAVCDRMVPIAFGNQTAGSLIRPAAYCGVYGLKPTYGTTDGAGILPLQLYFDTLGYMARCIEDLQSFYGIVSEKDQTTQWPEAQPAKIGICETFQWEFAEPASRSVLTQAAKLFARHGNHIEPFGLPSAHKDLVAVHRRVLYSGIATSLDEDFRNHADQMSDQLLDLLEEGRRTTAQEFHQAKTIAAKCRASVNDCFGDLDAIICPSAPAEAPHGWATGNPIFQVSWTLLGVPCLNLPVGIGPNGLPVGIQLIGRQYDDKKLLALGQHLTRDLPPIQA